MATKKAAVKKAKKQYYKVVDIKHGHHGFFYKVGVNTDPNPVPFDEMGTCDPGALYFIEGDKIKDWYDKGDSIAWVTPVGEMEKDGEKYRAHTLKVTKILPVAKALPLIPEANNYETFSSFNIPVTVKMMLTSFSIYQAADELSDEDNTENLVKLLAMYPANRKVIPMVKSWDLEWTADDIKALMKLGLIQVIGSSAIRDLFYEKEFKLLEQLAVASPKEFIEGVWEIL